LCEKLKLYANLTDIMMTALSEAMLMFEFTPSRYSSLLKRAVQNEIYNLGENLVGR